MGTSSLADSNICRLCGIESENTVFIFDPQDEEPFCVKINKYMPFQVYDDGRHPRHVCGACQSSVTATQVFLDGVMNGQRAIAALLQHSGPAAPSDPPALYPPVNALRSQLEADGVVMQKRRPGRPRKGEYSRKDPGTTPAAKPPPPPQQQPQPSPSPPLVRSHRQRGRLPARFQDTVKGGELERVLGGGDLGEVDGDDDPPTTAGEGAESAVPCHIRVEILAAPDERGRGLGGGTGVKTEPLSPAAAEHAGEKDTQAHDAAAPAPAPRGPGRGRRRKVRFQCDVCGKRFLYEGRLEFHRALHRGVRYECLGCSARFKLSAELSFHQTETGHTGQGIVEGVDSETLVDASRVPCPHCQLTFSTAHTLESHMLERHNPDKMYECNVCHKKFGQPGPLNTHQKSHLGRFHRQRRNCPECDKVCNSKTALNYHMETAHNTSRVLICNICGKSFQQKQLLTRHIAFVHSNERNFKCTWCPLAFKTKSHLSTHMLRHTGERPHGCPLCPRRFAHKTSLTLHLKWHRGEKPHECPICQKAFTQHSNMMEHQRTHTGERPFPCTFCSRAFTTNNQLQTHLRVHGAGRPLVCRPCGKTFTSRDRWKAHCRLHGPRRPLACTTCGKQMSNKWSLRSHMRTHDGKKAPADSGGAPILVCSVCSWTCEDAASLQRHQESTHGGGGDGTGQQLLASAGSLKQTESQVIYVTCQNPADPSTVQLVDGVTAAVGGARPVQLSADSEVLLEDAADGVVQLAANKGLITAEGTRTLELTTEDGRRIQITLQDVKGDLEPAELAAAAAAPEVGAGGEGTVALHATAETEQVEVEETEDLEGESVDVLVTASDGRQFRLVTPAGSDPVQLATEYIAGLGGTLG